MRQVMTKKQLAEDCALLILGAFRRYNEDFRALTQRTGRSFQRQDWQDVQACAVERIDLYDISVGQTQFKVSGLLDELKFDEEVWSLIKARYRELIEPEIDKELHKTYFNSMTRRTFGTVGVNASIEFVNIQRKPTDGIKTPVAIRRYTATESLDETLGQMLRDFELQRAYAQLSGCITFIQSHLSQIYGEDAGPIDFEMLQPHFFRGTRAYIVGRMVHRDEHRPFVLALMHMEGGLVVDAVLTSANAVSILFGFTRSYLHVDLETVGDTVLFLEKILPRKSIDEIYTVLGRAKQGKTERYRSLFRHLKASPDSEQFVVAPGSKGMVMAVFTLPSYDLVFKVIRDRFAYPKTVVRQEVLDSYELVFKHDRAGRLVDAQEFKRLTFDRNRFSQPVLDELLTENANSVIADENTLTIKHLYLERRITPLNLYLNDADPEHAKDIVSDYGQAIKDLSRCNIFPGDLLLKNFGVSRHERVIFYDYDELCLVTDCNFRRIPKPRHDAEEFSSEVWYDVGSNDIFPEQFVSFLGLSGELLAHLKSRHGEILTAEYWQQVKERLQAGEVLDFAPYNQSRYA